MLYRNRAIKPEKTLKLLYISKRMTLQENVKI